MLRCSNVLHSGRDFISVVNMEFVFLPDSVDNQSRCGDITTEADDILENTENFQVILNTSDTAVTVNPRNALISILDDDCKWETNLYYY